MTGETNRVPIRSYRLVTDKLERRIFKIEKYRLPVPYGVPVRSVLYFVLAIVGLGIAGSLPIVGQLLDLLPPSIHWLGLPGVIAYVLTRCEIDGRSPHVAMFGAARYLVRPKHLAGLRPCPPAGSELAPVHELLVAPSGEEAVYRAGRVKGPATVRFRYPAKVTAEKVRGGRGLSGQERLANAERLRVRPVPGSRPLVTGTEIRVPAGREVVFGE